MDMDLLYACLILRLFQFVLYTYFDNSIIIFGFLEKHF